MPYDGIYMWTLKVKTSKQAKENRDRFIYTETKLRRPQGMGEKVKEIKTYNFPVIKQVKSRGCNVQPRE